MAFAVSRLGCLSAALRRGAAFVRSCAERLDATALCGTIRPSGGRAAAAGARRRQGGQIKRARPTRHGRDALRRIISARGAVGLHRNSRLKVLSLWMNLIDDDNAAAFAIILANDGCALEDLNLGAQLCGDNPPGNSLGDVAAIAFGEALGSNTLLRVLKLERGCITAAGAAALAAGLQRQRHLVTGGLRRLTLAHNPLGARGVAALAEACCDTLTRLDVMTTGCGDEAAAAFGRALTPPSDGAVSPVRLAHLALGDNGITAVGVAALAAGLRRNTSVTVLDLRLNALGTTGLNALAGALQQPGGNTCLEVLIISDSGCAAWLPRSLPGAQCAAFTARRRVLCRCRCAYATKCVFGSRLLGAVDGLAASLPRTSSTKCTLRWERCTCTSAVCTCTGSSEEWPCDA